MSESSPARATRSSPVAIACLLVVGGLLGLSITIAKLATEQGTSPVALLFWASLGSGVVLQVVALAKGQAPRLRWQTFEYGAISGFLFAAPNIVALLAIHHIGAGIVSLTFAFPILFTYVLALVLRLEGFVGTRALGVAFGLCGAVLLVLPKVHATDAAFLWFCFAMAAPVIIAVGNIYRTMRWPVGETSLSLAPLMLIGGAIATLLIMVAAGEGRSLITFPTETALILLGAQTVVFTVMYACYFLLQWLAGPVYLSQIGSVAAVVGGAIAIGLLGEPLPQNMLLAAAFISAGVVLVSRVARTKAATGSNRRGGRGDAVAHEDLAG